MAENKYDIFISYRRKDGSERAELLRAIFVSRGYREDQIFMDTHSLRGGDFTQKLNLAIQQSANVVVVITKGCFGDMRENDYLVYEISKAMELKKNIIPVLFDGLTSLDEEGLPHALKDLPLHNAVRYDHEYTNAFYDKLMSFLVNSQQCSGDAGKDGDLGGFHPMINSGITFQLCAFVVFFLTFFMIMMSGCLAFYRNLQPSLLLLCIFLLVSIAATYKLRERKSIWLGVIAASDFFIIFYLSTLSDYLYKNWYELSRQTSQLPISIRYRLLYSIGEDMAGNSLLGMNTYLVVLAFLHIVIMCLMLCIRNERNKTGWQLLDR